MSPIVRELPSDLHLSSGNHRCSEEGMCVMEAAAYIAGEPHSDRPKCVCPVIGEFLRNWNDNLPTDKDRDRLLLPLLPVILDTRSTQQVVFTRSMLCCDWLIREYTPSWLDLVPSLGPHAKALRGLAPIQDESAVVAAQHVIVSARDSSRAARIAARIAAVNAARIAARIAAVNAAVIAVEIAAVSAAEIAAVSAVESALAPTAGRLQSSASDLVRRMVAVK